MRGPFEATQTNVTLLHSSFHCPKISERAGRIRSTPPPAPVPMQTHCQRVSYMIGRGERRVVFYGFGGVFVQLLRLFANDRFACQQPRFQCPSQESRPSPLPTVVTKTSWRTTTIARRLFFLDSPFFPNSCLIHLFFPTAQPLLVSLQEWVPHYERPWVG